MSFVSIVGTPFGRALYRSASALWNQIATQPIPHQEKPWREQPQYRNQWHPDAHRHRSTDLQRRVDASARVPRPQRWW
jgi:hypothetical protein